MSEAVQRLVDAADELTEKRNRWVYVEFRDPVKHRRVRKRLSAGRQSLVEILELDVERDDDTSPKKPGGERPRGFSSRPPGHYAPRELLHAFTRELSIWLANLGLDEREGPTHHIRAFVGIAQRLADEYPDTLTDLTVDLERWTSELRAYAGLDHVFRPGRWSCPHCDAVGRLTIQINGDHRRAERARCAACRTSWNTKTVGILIEHIRATGKATAAEGDDTTSPSPQVA